MIITGIAFFCAIYLTCRAMKNLVSHEKKYVLGVIAIIFAAALFIVYNRIDNRSENRRKTINEEIKICKSWHRTMNFINSQNYVSTATAESKKHFEQLRQDFIERQSNRHYQPYFYKKLDSKLYADLDKCSKEIQTISWGK